MVFKKEVEVKMINNRILKLISGIQTDNTMRKIKKKKPTNYSYYNQQLVFIKDFSKKN